jgi:hypothetical protein
MVQRPGDQFEGKYVSRPGGRTAREAASFQQFRQFQQFRNEVSKFRFIAGAFFVFSESG